MSAIILDETGTQRLLGYVIELHPDIGQAQCHLDITEAHTNRHGVLHGGIASTLLDNAMGATSSLTADNTGRVPFLTISMATQFVSPAFAGQSVTAKGRVTGGGKSLLFLAADLTDETGRIIASATGVFKRAKPRSGT